MEPWQQDLFNKLAAYSNNDIRMTMSMGRQSGKSAFQQLYREFMNKPSSRFVPYDLHHKHGLMIQDYMWWHANEREILNWMEANLPNGIEHQQGMTVTFDTDQERMLFLLRWS